MEQALGGSGLVCGDLLAADASLGLSGMVYHDRRGSVCIVPCVTPRQGLLDRAMIPRYAAFIVGSLLVLLPFHLPYYAIQRQWGFSTYLQECIYWAADPVLSYLSPPDLFNHAYLSLVQA
jgi:hypothetical protein